MDLGVKNTPLANIISSVESTISLSSNTNQNIKNNQKDNNNSCNLDFSNFITIYSLNVGIIYSKTKMEDQFQMWIPTNSGEWIKVYYFQYFTLLYSTPISFKLLILTLKLILIFSLRDLMY